MFDRVAHRYDLMNSVMSGGLHHRWRELAAERARLRSGDRALDVCCGTGDFALELARRVGERGEVVGLDFSAPMLEIARTKAARRDARIEFLTGNALDLPFDDGSFDAATVGFGVRNVVDLRCAIAEMMRVVRPCGRVVILEITIPQRPPLSWFYAVWFDRVVPLLGRVAGERDAYSYLPESVRRFPPAKELAGLMHDVGLREVRYALLAGGIVAIHAATVPVSARQEASDERPVRAEADGEARVSAGAFEDVLELLPGARDSMERAEKLLARVAAGHGSALAASAGDTLAAGGKRLRPLLVFICAGTREETDGAAEFRSEDHVRAAVAVELIHMATLVHDDVVDDALLRRGRPTVFAMSGRETATATGDFLFSRALSLLVENRSADQVATLSSACLSLARGELAQREDAHDLDVTIERYLRRCELKTGALFSAACVLGGLAGGRGAPEVAAMSSYGLALGVAFQLLDDVLDVGGSPERTGKRRGTDLLDGTVTLPLILARERDVELARLDLRDVTTGAQAEDVCLRIGATGVLDETRARAWDLVESAKAELTEAVPRDLEQRLTAVAERVADRYS